MGTLIPGDIRIAGKLQVEGNVEVNSTSHVDSAITTDTKSGIVTESTYGSLQYTLAFEDLGILLGRRFKVSPKATLQYFVNGKKYSRTKTDTVRVPSTVTLDGRLYYDSSNNLDYSSSLSEFSLITGTAGAYVAYIYYNTKVIILSYKGHSARNTSDALLSDTTELDGLRYRSGADIAGLVLGSAAVLSKLFSLTNVYLACKDILFTVTHSNSPANNFEQQLRVLFSGKNIARIPVVYFLGTVGTHFTAQYTAQNSVVQIGGTGYAMYNSLVGVTYTEIESPNNTHVNIYIIAVNSVTEPIKALQGTGATATLQEALDRLEQEVEEIKVAMPCADWAFLYRLVAHSSSSYAPLKVVIKFQQDLRGRIRVPQRISHADITSGTIDNVPIGGISPATGSFTTLSYTFSTPNTISITNTDSPFDASFISTIFANATLGNIQIFLPSVVSVAKATYTIRRTDSSTNSLFVSALGGEFIDGHAQITIPGESTVTMINDSFDWYTLNNLSYITETLGLIDNSSTPNIILKTALRGSYSMVVQSELNDGACATFMCSKSRSAIAPSRTRVTSSPGSQGEILDIVWNATEKVKLYHSTPASPGTGATLQYLVRFSVPDPWLS
jgi:hypothetical protein